MVERAEGEDAERSVRVNEDGSDGVDCSVAAACDDRLAIVVDGSARELNNLLAALSERDSGINVCGSEDRFELRARLPFRVSRGRRVDEDRSARREARGMSDGG